MSVVLCRLDEITDGESRGFEYELEDDDIEFFVVRKGQSVYGYFNDCPHIGTPLTALYEHMMPSALPSCTQALKAGM